MTNSVSVILLQETQTTSNDKVKIYGYTLVDAVHHNKHGITTLVRNDLTAQPVAKSKDSEMQLLTIKIKGDITITNI